MTRLQSMRGQTPSQTGQLQSCPFTSELWALCKQSRPNKCLLDEQTNIQFMGLRSAGHRVPGGWLTQLPTALPALGSNACVAMSVPLRFCFQARPSPHRQPPPPACSLRWLLGLPTGPILPSSLAASGGCEMRKARAQDTPTPRSVLRPEPGGLLKTNGCSPASSSRKWGAETLRRPCSRIHDKTMQGERGRAGPFMDCGHAAS